jgi:hypothetical protein
MNWFDLSGSAVDGCGDGKWRNQEGQGATAQWNFSTGSQSCTFELYIPNSSSITSTSIYYQLSYGANVLHANLDQKDGRGQWIRFDSIPATSPTGTFALRLVDNQSLPTKVVADAAKAVCS